MKTISITQDHIDQGIRASCNKCPLALAIKEIFPDKKILVGYNVVFVNSYIGIELPEDLMEFIYSFDSGKLVEPREFQLDI